MNTITLPKENVEEIINSLDLGIEYYQELQHVCDLGDKDKETLITMIQLQTKLMSLMDKESIPMSNMQDLDKVMCW